MWVAFHCSSSASCKLHSSERFDRLTAHHPTGAASPLPANLSGLNLLDCASSQISPDSVDGVGTSRMSAYRNVFLSGQVTSGGYASLNQRNRPRRDNGAAGSRPGCKCFRRDYPTIHHKKSVCSARVCFCHVKQTHKQSYAIYARAVVVVLQRLRFTRACSLPPDIG